MAADLQLYERLRGARSSLRAEGGTNEPGRLGRTAAVQSSVTDRWEIFDQQSQTLTQPRGV